MIERRSVLQAAAAALIACHASPTFSLGRLADLDDDSVNAFLKAVRDGDLAAVTRYLDKDTGLLTARDESGRSAFVLAALAGQPAICAELSKRGLALDVVEAVLAEDWDRVDAMVAANAALVERSHPIGGTPLYAAALGGVPNMWRLRRLGCDPDARPEAGSGFTPARAAMDARTEGHAIRAATDLLGNGADPNAAQKDGDSVLHGAVRRQSEFLVRLAIRKGASVEAKDGQGLTPSGLAQSNGWDKGAALLARHADLPRDHRASRFLVDVDRKPVKRPDLSDVPQSKLNDVAGASHFNVEATKAFLKEDARLSFAISNDDEMAVEACGHIGHRELIGMHLANGAAYALPTAVSNGDAEHVKYLLDRDGALIHERGAHDFPLMWFPVMGGGDVAMAELLHARGTSLDQDSAGFTALHQCVLRESIDLASWLIESGANLNPVGYLRSAGGQTPLDLARERDAKALVRLLEQKGAKGHSS